MQRGISTMEGKVAGQDFVTKYQQAYAQASEEERRDPTYAKTLYDNMHQESVDTLKKGDPHYAGSFLRMTRHPEGKGENLVLQNTVGAEGRLKEYGKSQVKQAAVGTALDVFSTTVDKVNERIGLDPKDSNALSRSEQRDLLAAGIDLDLNGDGQTTATGQANTGLFGDGLLSVDDGDGMKNYLDGMLSGVVSMGLDPQVFLDALDHAKGANNTPLSTQVAVRAWIADYTQPGGSFDKDTKNYYNHILENRLELGAKFDDLVNQVKIASENLGEEDKVDGLLEELKTLVPKVFIDPVVKTSMMTNLKKYKLDSIDTYEDALRQAQLAMNREVQKNREYNMYKTSVITPALQQAFVQSIASPNGYAQKDLDTLINELASGSSGFTATQIEGMYVQGLKTYVANLSTTLVENGVETTQHSPQSPNQYSLPSSLTTPRTFRPVGVDEGPALVGKAMVNAARSHSGAHAGITRRISELITSWDSTENPNEFLASSDGLELKGLVWAATRMKRDLATLVKTGGDAGNFLQRATGLMGTTTPTEDEIVNSLLKTKTERATEDTTESEEQREYMEESVSFGGGGLGGAWSRVVHGGRPSDSTILNIIADTTQSGSDSSSTLGFGSTPMPQHANDMILGRVQTKVMALLNTTKEGITGATEQQVENAYREASRSVGEEIYQWGTSDAGVSLTIMNKGQSMWLDQLQGHIQNTGGDVGDFLDWLKGTSLSDEDTMTQDRERLALLSADDPEYDVLKEVGASGDRLVSMADQEEDFASGNIHITQDEQGNIFLQSGDDTSINDIYMIDQDFMINKVNEYGRYATQELKGGGQVDEFSKDDRDYVGHLSEKAFNRLYDEQEENNRMATSNGWTYQNSQALSIHTYYKNDRQWQLPLTGRLPKPYKLAESGSDFERDTISRLIKNKKNYNFVLHEDGEVSFHRRDMHSPRPRLDSEILLHAASPKGSGKTEVSSPLLSMYEAKDINDYESRAQRLMLNRSDILMLIKINHIPQKYGPFPKIPTRPFKGTVTTPFRTGPY